MPILNKAELTGSGTLAVAGIQQAAPAGLVLTGSGDMSFQGNVTDLSARIVGSGDIVASGTAAHVALCVEGSGNISARNVAAAAASLQIRGSGDLDATVTGTVQASITGSGDIDLYGDVVLTQRSIGGSGEIRVH